MIIYEVNLSVEHEIESVFIPWLKSHSIKMLKFEGLTSASLLRDVENVSESTN